MFELVVDMVIYGPKGPPLNMRHLLGCYDTRQDAEEDNPFAGPVDVRLEKVDRLRPALRLQILQAMPEAVVVQWYFSVVSKRSPA